MPEVNGTAWREGRARLRLTPRQARRAELTEGQRRQLGIGDRSRLTQELAALISVTSDQAGRLLGIKGGALRQIEQGIKPASLALAYRAAELYGCDVLDLLAKDNEPVEEPPSRKQDSETKTGPGRGTGGTTSGSGGAGTRPQPHNAGAAA